MKVVSVLFCVHFQPAHSAVRVDTKPSWDTAFLFSEINTEIIRTYIMYMW